EESLAARGFFAALRMTGSGTGHCKNLPVQAGAAVDAGWGPSRVRGTMQAVVARIGMKLPHGNTTTPTTLTTPATLTTLAIIPCNRFQERCHGWGLLTCTSTN